MFNYLLAFLQYLFTFLFINNFKFIETILFLNNQKQDYEIISFVHFFYETLNIFVNFQFSHTSMSYSMILFTNILI